jgi:hypothetical protein
VTVASRQNVLVLYLADSALDSHVVGWARYDGSSEGPMPPVDVEAKPPYRTGLDALRDGWRLFQASQLTPPAPGSEHQVSYLKHEFLFEKLVEVDT